MIRIRLLQTVALLLIFSTQLYAQRRPNILIIVSDDHAYQTIGAYGSKLMKTPNIDRLAREGVRFDNAYVTNSICGPSRAVILTGKYSHKNGFKDNESSRFDGSQNTFIKELTKAGYQTAWIGKWHLETIPRGFTFWQVLPGQGMYYNPDFIMMDSSKKRIEGYAANIIEDLAEDWLDKRDTTQPFCLVIGHKSMHRTWIPDTCDMGMFDKVTFPLPANFYDDYAGRSAAKVQDMTIAQTMRMGYDLKMFDSEKEENNESGINRMTPDQRKKFDACYHPIHDDFKKQHLTGKALVEWKYQRYMRDYLSTAASLDRNIGRTLAYLDKHHLDDNTIVIYLSDQGFYMGEHGWFDKRWMYEPSFRTPMMMRYPGVVKPGTVNRNMVMNLDIAPTALSAAGLAVPKDIQGSSILPLVTNTKAKGRNAMYYHYYENGEHQVSPHFGISTGRYKLIRFYKRVVAWELYDLQKDPDEMHNLYGMKEYGKTVQALKQQLNKLIDQYDDNDARSVLHDETVIR
ncbi:sulfatase family protein [Chitinophaga sp. 22321]|uniref:Sulfatase n=1 Tax=Chitinophaga hostae TaxID=2831022 RepID=A0ABS5J9D7_9BACT|nr:sulfatase [Chitinophaga hostae]MBS0031826.1 sulfatase [Chitinophaga hostae]